MMNEKKTYEIELHVFRNNRSLYQFQIQFIRRYVLRVNLTVTRVNSGDDNIK